MSLTLPMRQGYAVPALAKSSVWVRSQLNHEVHKHLRSLSAFFMPAVLDQWWAAWEHFRVRRYLVGGTANPVQSITHCFAALSDGLKTHHKEASMPNLTILAKQIRQIDGLYSLNDIHRASGFLAMHQPYKFLRLKQTQALIDELSSSPDVARTVSTNFGGSRKGTFACKQLVVAYAAWISPKVHLAVINAFLAEQSSKPLPLDDADKYALLDSMINSMGFTSEPVVVPREQLEGMLRGAYHFQRALRVMQSLVKEPLTPTWFEQAVHEVEACLGRTVRRRVDKQQAKELLGG
jgi:hypothetical protein